MHAGMISGFGDSPVEEARGGAPAGSHEKVAASCIKAVGGGSSYGTTSISLTLATSQRLPILHRNLDNECAFIPVPAIADETAGQPITVMVDLYERSTAAVASTGHFS
jgi:hypothetical protein